MTNIPVEFNRIRDGAVRQLAGNFVKLEDVNHQPISNTNPLPGSLVDASGNPIQVIDEKLRVSSTPYGYDVVEGNIPDHSHILVNAWVLNATNTWSDMWGGAPATPNAPILTAAITMEVVGGAQETAAGTGISQIEVHYLDGNGVAQSQTVTLTGAVAVPLVGNILHINAVHAIAAGAGATAPFAASANIDIRATGGGTVYARIPAGYVTAPRMVFRIPANATGYWVDLMAFVLALSNNSDAQLQIVSNFNMSDSHALPQGLWIPHWNAGGGSAGANVNVSLAFPFKFVAGSIIKCRVRRVSGAGNADGFITGSGWIEY